MEPEAQGAVVRLVFEGRSMVPTLREPALLDLEPLAFEAIRAGDVLAFRARGSQRPVVHRALALAADGWRTGGDGNRKPDDELLTPDRLLGRVVTVSVGPRRRRLVNGRWGLAWYRLLRLRLAVRRLASRAGLGPLVGRAETLVARLLLAVLPRGWRPTRVAYADGREQCVLGRRVVARRAAPDQPWQGGRLGRRLAEAGDRP